MRSTALWTIAIGGTVAFVLASVFMLVMLRRVESSPKSGQVRLANEIEGSFNCENALVRVATEEKETILILEYRTRVDSKFDEEAMDGEMGDIAEFALENFSSEELGKNDILFCRVIRHEARPSGCSVELYTNEAEYDNPDYGKEKSNPYDF
jgi:hypothetical protein